MDFYREIFRSFEEAWPPFKIKQRSLTVPGDLQPNTITDEIYQRLSVAYGLSFDPLNIADIIKKQNIEDQEREPPESSYTDNYIGSDQV